MYKELLQHFWPRKNIKIQLSILGCLCFMTIERFIVALTPIYNQNIGKILLIFLSKQHFFLSATKYHTVNPYLFARLCTLLTLLFCAFVRIFVMTKRRTSMKGNVAEKHV